MPESTCQRCGGAVIRETQGVLTTCPDCLGLPPQPARERPADLLARLVLENRRLRQAVIAWRAYDLATNDLPDRMPHEEDFDLVRVRHAERLHERALRRTREAVENG